MEIPMPAESTRVIRFEDGEWHEVRGQSGAGMCIELEDVSEQMIAAGSLVSNGCVGEAIHAGSNPRGAVDGCLAEDLGGE